MVRLILNFFIKLVKYTVSHYPFNYTSIIFIFSAHYNFPKLSGIFRMMILSKEKQTLTFQKLRTAQVYKTLCFKKAKNVDHQNICRFIIFTYVQFVSFSHLSCPLSYPQCFPALPSFAPHFVHIQLRSRSCSNKCESQFIKQ